MFEPKGTRSTALEASTLTIIPPMSCQKEASLFSTTTLFTKLYAMVVILLACAKKHSRDRIISLSGEIWAHRASRTLPLSIGCVCTTPGEGTIMFSLTFT